MLCKKDFVNYIQSAYNREAGQLDAEVEKWRKQFDPNNALFGYTPPGWPLPMASAAAFLYEINGDRKMAETAYSILKQYREWTKIMPAAVINSRPEYKQGVPPIEPVFQPLVFIPTAERIRPAITREEYAELGNMVADSLRQITFFPEWGGHNRAMLRAAGLAIAARAFPSHADAAQWASLADELAEESWGRWSLEDAQMYQSHWLRALIFYSEARGKREFVNFIQPRMVLRSMTQLITPLNALPDYGDSHWMTNSQWEWLANLEWGAKTYKDETMKWAADKLWKQVNEVEPHFYGANILTYAWRWCDDLVGAHEPVQPDDALDELILKKKVFRTGYDEKATYGLFTYRDEGTYGLIARDYLRTTLAVSAEKMHHGHADEGSFSTLVHKGTVLLHESGYREFPPDGIYRSDVYHNRLLWRKGGRPEEKKSMVEYLRGNGHYRPMQTQRLYQTHLDDAEIVRLRIQDLNEPISWDRTIFFLAALPAWVVIDTIFDAQPTQRVLSSMWWTNQVLKQGETWLETFVDGFIEWKNPQNAALLFVFPHRMGGEHALQVEKSRRCYHDETAILDTWAGTTQPGTAVNFVSVLWPHDYADLNPQRALGVHLLDSQPSGRGVGVSIDWQGETRRMTTLNDLKASWIGEDMRPRYLAEKGLATFDNLASDAAFTYTHTVGKETRIGFINGTFLAYQDKVLYQAPSMGMFQEDASFKSGIPARFRWEGKL